MVRNPALLLLAAASFVAAQSTTAASFTEKLISTGPVPSASSLRAGSKDAVNVGANAAGSGVVMESSALPAFPTAGTVPGNSSTALGPSSGFASTTIPTSLGSHVISGVASATGDHNPYHNMTTGTKTSNNTGPTGAPVAKPNADGFSQVTPCQQGAGSLHGCGNCFPDLAIYPTPLANASLMPFDNSEFAVQGGGAGGVAWFSVPQPKENCKVLFFGETPGLSPPIGTPGYFVAVAENEGCYYVNAADRLSVSYCCGDDQCEGIGAGIMAGPSTRRKRTTAREFRAEIATGEKAPREQLPSTSRRTKIPATFMVEEKRSDPTVYTFFSANATFSASTNYVPPPAGPAQWCEAAVPVPGAQEFGRAGRQQLVGVQEQCTGTFCSYSVSTSVETGTSVEVSNEDQKTTSHGVNANVQFGSNDAFDTGATLLFTVGTDASWSNAVSNSTATTNSSSTSNEFSGTLGVQYGLLSQLSVVPQQVCQQMTAKCHNGTDTMTLNVEKCVPASNSSSVASGTFVAFPVNFGSI